MEDVAASLMDVLRRCILTDCCSTVNGASEYQDRWRCNFLGISHTGAWWIGSDPALPWR